jgi:hypothetical protein
MAAICVFGLRIQNHSLWLVLAMWILDFSRKSGGCGRVRADFAARGATCHLWDVPDRAARKDRGDPPRYRSAGCGTAGAAGPRGGSRS